MRGVCGPGAREHHGKAGVRTFGLAALLAWKQPISGFVVGLSEPELRSAILLAILSFLIYPVLPTQAVDPWGLIEPQGTWVTVLLIAALGFINYVLWKVYGPRGIDITSFLGGLVNSTAGVAELAQRVKEGGESLLALAYRGVLLATTAMLVRNSLLLAILAWPAFVSSLAPRLLMAAASILFVWKSSSQRRPDTQAPRLHLEQPFSLRAALKFGLTFLALHVAGTLGQRQLGPLGFYAVSIAGGLLSSASAVAAAGTAAAHGQVSFQIAADAAVLASLTSTLIDVPLMARAASQRRLTARLSVALGTIAAAGIAGIGLHDWLKL